MKTGTEQDKTNRAKHRLSLEESTELFKSGEDLAPGAPRVLMKVPEGTMGADATRDGERSLVTGGPERDWDIRLILNGTSLLKR